MPATLIPTPGASTANTYTTRAEADTYFDDRLYSTDWTGASATDKDRALLWATKLLDEQMEWTGDVVTATQALAWPRSAMEDHLGNSIDDEVIPVRLKHATAELACYLIRSDRTDEQSADGIAGLSLGSLEVDFDQPGPKRKVLPDAVYQLIAHWGERRFGRSTVSLVRV